jgi:hypothetical protein
MKARKIFLSYRRDDAAAEAGRLGDRLALELGRDSIFIDVDGIPLGTNFVRRLTDEVNSCDALLALMGPKWLDACDDNGNRRINNPNDFVRIEISAALRRDIPVIPILLNGTKIPRADRLPPDLQELVVRSALDVRHQSFHSDVARLVRELKQLPTGKDHTLPPAPDVQNPTPIIATIAQRFVVLVIIWIVIGLIGFVLSH